jgi:toxin ParE1/3/4
MLSGRRRRCAIFSRFAHISPQDSPLYADLVIRRIVAAIERLSTFPESGRIVPERNVPHLREVIVSPYRAVYRLREGTVEVVTVFRASRLFPTGIEE